MGIKDWIPAGAILVSVVAWFVNNFLDRRRKMSERRAEAYVDYLNGISRVENLPDRNSKEWHEANILTLEARHQILLYGSPNVIAALQKASQVPRLSVSSAPSSRAYQEVLRRIQEAHVEVIQAMQSDSGRYKSNYKTIHDILIAERRIVDAGGAGLLKDK